MQGGDKRADTSGPIAPNTGPISRREFLQIASLTGVIGGLGGVLAACDRSGEPSNTTATIVAQQATSTTSSSTVTTVKSGPEKGRDIRLGLVSARTGPLALFGKAEDWWTGFAIEALSDGILCGDGKLRRVTFVREDSRSDPDRAARAARQLITSGRIDMIMCFGGAKMVNPVADQAEELSCPCICSFVQWRPFFFGRGGTAETPFRWTYAHAVGLEDVATNFVAMWEQLETNKKVGFIFAESTDGWLWMDAEAGLPPVVAAAGYERVQHPPYPVPTLDFTQHISEFKRNGCEICCGAMPAADFINFWRQSLEQGYNPKVVTIGEGLLFPQALEAVGPIAQNLTTESLWQPEWPYRDSITGKTCQEMASDYQAKTGEQWIAAIAQYANFEWAVDVFRRVRYVDNSYSIASGIRTAKLDTCLGPLDFTAPVDAADSSGGKRPVENVYKAPVGGAQWVEGDIFPFEQTLVTDVTSPDLPVLGRVQPMVYGL